MVDFGKIAMVELERLYPIEIKRFDELYDKEKRGVITKDELRELNALDRMLLREFERLKLHYMINWNFMSEDKKREILGKIERG